ncbi:MAG: murein biosynthesis integral membrane protein MurJ [Dermatophilaceae bacterium]
MNTPAPSVGRSGAVMAAGSLVSRVAGLLRASLLASVIGTSGLTATAFATANTLPNQFYLLLAGGALNAVLVPQILRARTRGQDGAEFVNRVITASLALLVVATILLTALAPLLVRLYLRVDNADAVRLATVFAVICLPQVFFYGLYTLLGQVLTAHNRFFAYTWAPALANLVAVGGLVWFRTAALPREAPPGEWTAEMIGILGGTATASIAIQALALIVPLRRIGFRYRPVWGFRGHGLGELSNVATWTFGSIVVSQLGYVVTSNVLTRVSDRADRADVTAPDLASFQNALLAMMLAHGLVTVSLVTALFTQMSDAASRNDDAELLRLRARGLRMPAVLLVPGIALVLALAPVVTSTFLFDNSLAGSQTVAVVLLALIGGVLPLGWVYVNDRTFYAKQQTWWSFRTQCVITGTATVGALVAASLDPRHTAVALSLGQSIAYLVGALYGFIVLRRQHGALGLRAASGMLTRLVLPAGVTAIVLGIAVRMLLPDLGATRGIPALLEGVVVLGVAGVIQLAVTWGVAHVLGVREVARALEPLLHRLPHR